MLNLNDNKLLKATFSIYLHLLQSATNDLRHSTRIRKMAINLEVCADNSGTEDNDITVRFYSLSSIFSILV